MDVAVRVESISLYYYYYYYYYIDAVANEIPKTLQGGVLHVLSFISIIYWQYSKEEEQK